MEDIYEKIRNGDYDNKVPYPAKPKDPIANRNMSNVKPEDVATVAKAMEDYPRLMEEYRVKKEEYRKEEGRMIDLFTADLEKFFDMENHPKKAKFFALAWDMGHSAGFGEIASYYARLMEVA